MRIVAQYTWKCVLITNIKCNETDTNLYNYYNLLIILNIYTGPRKRIVVQCTWKCICLLIINMKSKKRDQNLKILVPIQFEFYNTPNNSTDPVTR